MKTQVVGRKTIARNEWFSKLETEVATKGYAVRTLRQNSDIGILDIAGIVSRNGFAFTLSQENASGQRILRVGTVRSMQS